MTTVIKRVELFFQEGNSDKVYNASIVETAPGTYTVAVEWGRRGSALNKGNKAVGVSLEQARKIRELEEELEATQRKLAQVVLECDL